MVFAGRDCGADEDVPGEGDFGQRQPIAQRNCVRLLPQCDIQPKADDHSDDCSRLRGVLRNGAEEEDSEERSIRDGGDGEADLDDVAFAADLDAIDGNREEDERPHHC